MPYTGRILVTDHSAKDDRDNVIENILRHRSSRAAVYVLFKDFQDVTPLLAKFPTVIPIVIDPLRNLEETRKLLNLLPYMNHYINFLGDSLAQEFLGRRTTFRVKDVSINYVMDTDRVINKVMESSEGIIFNVSNDGNSRNSCLETVETIKNKIEKPKKTLSQLKNFIKSKSKVSDQEGSRSERASLLSNEDGGEENGPGSSRRQSNVTSDGNQECNSDRRQSSFLDLLISILCCCFPWFNRKSQHMNVALNVDQYPPDLDSRMDAALQQFHEKEGEKWRCKVERAHDKKFEALSNAQKRNQEWKQKELAEMRRKSEGLNQTTLSSAIPNNLSQKIVDSRERRDSRQVYQQATNILKQENREIELKFAVENFWDEHYQHVVEKQFGCIISVWKEISGNGCFG